MLGFLLLYRERDNLGRLSVYKLGFVFRLGLFGNASAKIVVVIGGLYSGVKKLSKMPS